MSEKEKPLAKNFSDGIAALLVITITGIAAYSLLPINFSFNFENSYAQWFGRLLVNAGDIVLFILIFFTSFGVVMLLDEIISASKKNLNFSNETETVKVKQNETEIVKVKQNEHYLILLLGAIVFTYVFYIRIYINEFGNTVVNLHSMYSEMEGLSDSIAKTLISSKSGYWDEIVFYSLALLFIYSWLKVSAYYTTIIFGKNSFVQKNANLTNLALFLIVLVLFLTFQPLLLWYILIGFSLFTIYKAFTIR